MCNFASAEEGAAAAAIASSEWEQVHPAPAFVPPRPRPKSGFYGVSANRKKWRDLLYYDGKKHQLGNFNAKQEAAAAYDTAARQHKGDAAVCNFASAEEGAAAAEWECAPASPPAAAAPPAAIIVATPAVTAATAAAVQTPDFYDVQPCGKRQVRSNGSSSNGCIDVTYPTYFEQQSLTKAESNSDSERSSTTSSSSTVSNRNSIDRGMA
jgi:hypothetical protein